MSEQKRTQKALPPLPQESSSPRRIHARNVSISSPQPTGSNFSGSFETTRSPPPVPTGPPTSLPTLDTQVSFFDPPSPPECSPTSRRLREVLQILTFKQNSSSAQTQDTASGETKSSSAPKLSRLLSVRKQKSQAFRGGTTDTGAPTTANSLPTSERPLEFDNSTEMPDLSNTIVVPIVVKEGLQSSISMAGRTTVVSSGGFGYAFVDRTSARITLLLDDKPIDQENSDQETFDTEAGIEDLLDGLEQNELRNAMNSEFQSLARSLPADDALLESLNALQPMIIAGLMEERKNEVGALSQARRRERIATSRLMSQQ